MAEERQPPTIHEGADPEDDAPVALKSAEDRKTAAALSSLDKRDDDDTDGARGAKSQLDQEALGKAMSRLEVGGTKSGEKGAGKGKEAKEAEAEVGRRKAVKVEPADVALLVSFFILWIMCAGGWGWGWKGADAGVGCDRLRSWSFRRGRLRIC
jgi:hypothetical protein